jgi:hypothetical protein
LQEDFQKSGLKGYNYWKDVQDFKWIKKEKSPHFKLIFDGKEQVPEEEEQPVFHNPTHAVPAQVLKQEEPKPAPVAKPAAVEEPRTIINSDKFEMPKQTIQTETLQSPPVSKPEPERPATKPEPEKPAAADDDDEIDEL